MELYRRRLEKLQQAMLREGVDVYLAATQVNMQYLSGFSEPPLERLMFLLVSQQGEPVWFAPALSAASTATNPAGWQTRYVWHDSEGPSRALEACTRDFDLETATIAVDDEMPAAFLLRLQEALPAALFRAGGELMGSVRAVKDADEVRCMREAARLTDDALASGLERCMEGYSEWAVAIAIQRALFDMGSKLAFGIPLVASGAMSAMPHHTTSQRTLQKGDIIVIDYGGVYEGYCSDITRVACVGRASDEARAVYEIVNEAHMRA
jgi:Xaa-Pro dipeptidase